MVACYIIYAEQKSLQQKRNVKERLTNMTYELFQQGPATYVPIILVSLVITLAAYGAFPLILARARKKTITKRKYNLLCFCVNFLVMVLFIVVNGEPSSGGPYLLWTWVFSASGIKTLKNRGVLDEFQNSDYTKTVEYNENEVDETVASEKTVIVAEEVPILKDEPRIRFCRKCGFELIDGSEFCNGCGTAIERSDRYEMS